MDVQLKARLKAIGLRCWHLGLVMAGVLIPLVAALSDSAGTLGRYGGVGIVAIGVIGVATTISHTWRPPESSVYKRAFAVVGTLSNVVSPLMTFMYTRLPSTTKGYLLLGTAAALAGSLRGAFGSRIEVAVDRVEKLEVATTGAKVEAVGAIEAKVAEVVKSAAPLVDPAKK